LASYQQLPQMSGSALVSLASAAKQGDRNEDQKESGKGHCYGQERARPLE
jgi:hypothetical protein